MPLLPSTSVARVPTAHLKAEPHQYCHANLDAVMGTVAGPNWLNLWHPPEGIVARQGNSLVRAAH